MSRLMVLHSKISRSITSVDPAMLMSSSAEPLDDSVYSGPYKFPFIPPSDSFNLRYYTCQVPFPPILGCYQLIEEDSQLKITVNLKLHESMKNSFLSTVKLIYLFSTGFDILSFWSTLVHQERVTRIASMTLYFRIPHFTLTGCYVDQHSIQIFAPGKAKITASLELISSDYYIWNSKAPAPMVYKALFD